MRSKTPLSRGVFPLEKIGMGFETIASTNTHFCDHLLLVFIHHPPDEVLTTFVRRIE